MNSLARVSRWNLWWHFSQPFPRFNTRWCCSISIELRPRLFMNKMSNVDDLKCGWKTRWWRALTRKEIESNCISELGMGYERTMAVHLAGEQQQARGGNTERKAKVVWKLQFIDVAHKRSIAPLSAFSAFLWKPNAHELQPSCSTFFVLLTASSAIAWWCVVIEFIRSPDTRAEC